MSKLLNYKKASTLYSKITDGTHDSPKQQIIGKPLITSKHIKGRNIDFETAYLISEVDYKKINERSQVEKWDVIVSMIGEYCGFSYIERNDNIDYAVKNVGLYKTESKLEAEWLYYYLNSPIGRQHLNSVKSGSSQPYLTLGALRNLPILQAKNLNSKSKIVKILSDLDAKIEINNRINNELEAMAKTLYNYWFVQFDFPGANGKPYKSSGGEMVYNTILKREVPKGWEVRTFDGLLSFTRGVSYTSSTMNEHSGIPMINLKSFNLNGTYRSNGLKYFTGKLNTSRIINKDDLLIAITDVTREAEIIGRAILTPNFEVDAVCSCDVARVDVLNNSFSKNYLRYLFNSQYYHDYIKHYASGTLVLHLDLNGVLWYTDVIPPSELQTKFEDFVNNIDNKIQSNLKQNQELAQLRDWLLPMLMNGQVTVSDAEEMVEEKLDMVAEGNVEYKKN